MVFELAGEDFIFHYRNILLRQLAFYEGDPCHSLSKGMNGLDEGIAHNVFAVSLSG